MKWRGTARVFVAQACWCASARVGWCKQLSYVFARSSYTPLWTDDTRYFHPPASISLLFQSWLVARAKTVDGANFRMSAAGSSGRIQLLLWFLLLDRSIYSVRIPFSIFQRILFLEENNKERCQRGCKKQQCWSSSDSSLLVRHFKHQKSRRRGRRMQRNK